MIDFDAAFIMTERDGYRGSLMKLTAVIRAILLSFIAIAISCDKPRGPVLGPEVAPKREPLIGLTAPDIEAKLLDGSPFSLKAQVGEVVILDFWATWCRPCLIELPVVLKIADDYKSRGVVLYTINSGEKTAVIREFLQEQHADFNVVLDPDDKVATAYLVTGIPRLVVIDRKGLVKAVHAGFSSDLDRELRAQLDELVAQ